MEEIQYTYTSYQQNAETHNFFLFYFVRLMRRKTTDTSSSAAAATPPFPLVFKFVSELTRYKL